MIEDRNNIFKEEITCTRLLFNRNLVAIARKENGFGVRKIDTNCERDFIGIWFCTEAIWDLYEHSYSIEGVEI